MCVCEPTPPLNQEGTSSSVFVFSLRGESFDLWGFLLPQRISKETSPRDISKRVFQDNSLRELTWRVPQESCTREFPSTDLQRVRQYNSSHAFPELVSDTGFFKRVCPCGFPLEFEQRSARVFSYMYIYIYIFLKERIPRFSNRTFQEFSQV